MNSSFGIATGAFVAERDDWSRAVDRAAEERWRAVELTAITEDRYAALLPYLATRPPLEQFDRVSVHAPVILRSSVTSVTESIVAGLAYDVVFHPDVYGSQDALEALGDRAVFENMDVMKRFGRTVGDLAGVFRRLPAATFCLDVAHVWTNDRSMRLGLDLLDAFGDRLRQVHVSGIEPDGTHRLTTEADLALYEPLLARCDHVLRILESELQGVAVSHPMRDLPADEPCGDAEDRRQDQSA